MTQRTGGRRRAPNRRLQQLRIDEGLSPNALGSRAGVSGSTVRLAEKGFIPCPRSQFLIADVFGLKPTDLWPIEVQVAA